MSKTGLEALACGLQMLNHELKYVKGLPQEHRSEFAAKSVMDIYHSVA